VDSEHPTEQKKRLPSWLGTIGIVVIYVALMACSNTRFTMLDDESNSLAFADRPVVSTLQPFFTSAGDRELHPPETEILWHLWLVATHSSFFLLRIPANILFAGAVFFAAMCARGLAGCKAYWATLLLGLIWPFAFQYGRIAGWYTLSTFLLSLSTWIYFQLLGDRSNWLWAWFTAACVLLLWSNYFGFVFLSLLLADLLLFHRGVARSRRWQLLITIGVIGTSFLPLLATAFDDVVGYVGPAASEISFKSEIAAVGYPAFAIFGSGAVAPWYLPLSLPIAAAVVALMVAIWFGSGRRWLVYVVLAMAAMDLARVFDIKRVLIFLPWLFLAMGMAMFGSGARLPRLAQGAIAIIVIAGWSGIVSGKHYATSNLLEPWAKVARVVADDARHGGTIVSDNPPFFLYLDYELGLGSEMPAADSGNVRERLYRAHGYTILGPDHDGEQAGALRGKVVLVRGSGVFADVDAMNTLRDALSLRCTMLGEYRAAPDPALAWKRQFTKGVPLLNYRADVNWFDCH
jgi:hypothetical protein